MIHITAQMRVLVAIEAVDGRKYAPSINMRSERSRVAKSGRSTGFERRITCPYPLDRIRASNLSGGRN